MRRIKVLILASHYRADHVDAMRLYNRINPAASSWNNALFAALSKLDIELHIAQFYPVARTYEFIEGNATYYYLPRVPKVDGFTSLIKRARVRRLARRIRPDLIHGIGSEHGHAWAAIHRDRPSMITIHGYLKFINRIPGHRNILRRLFLEREERKALLAADTLIAINGYMRDQFVLSGCHPDKIRVIANAMNPIHLALCENGGRDIDILMVGTLHPLKNQHVALDIFSRMASEHGLRPAVVIAGAPTVASRGYYDGLLKQKADKHLDNVQFAGSLDPAALKQLYCRSKLLLHVSSFEADPSVVAEALASECIPVVNPVAGMAYRVQHGINGYRLPIDDLDRAAADLTSILKQCDSASELAARGRAAVIAERSPENVARATIEAYKSTQRHEGFRETKKALANNRRFRE